MVEISFSTLPELPAVESTRVALEELTWTLIELTTADQVFVYRRNDPAGPLDPVIALGMLSLSEKQAFWSGPLDPAVDVLLAHLIESPRPFSVVTEAERRQFGPSLLAGLKTKSFLIYPLANHGTLLGLVLFAWQQPGFRLPAEQVRLADAVTRSMALALDNARLYEVTSQQLHQALSLQEITRAILNKVDLEEVLDLIAQEAVRLTAALGCVIRLADDNGHMQIAYQTGRVAPSPLDEGSLSAWSENAQRREPVLFNVKGAAGEGGEPVSILLVPLWSGQETPSGFLEIYQHPGYFLPHDITTASSFAGQVAVAIDHARLYRRIQLTAVAEERARLARDLHDSISQSLYAMTLFTRAARRQQAKGRFEAVDKYLAELDNAARNVLGEMRLLIFELRPASLEKNGLVGALQHRLNAVEGRSSIEVFQQLALAEPLPRDVEDNLYRIAQEAFNNVIKHAGAGRLWVDLDQAAGQVRLRVRDDGRGFDVGRVPPDGLGLKNMQERVQAMGGKLSIQSAPGSGTLIQVEVPYGEDQDPGR